MKYPLFSYSTAWIVVFFLSNTCFAGIQDLSLEQITRSWKNRESQIHSIRIKWVDHHVIPKGSMHTPKGQVSGKAGSKANLLIPETDQLFDILNTVVIDYDRIAHSQEGKAWKATLELTDACTKNAFNGKISKAYRPVGAIPYPVGEINNLTTILNVRHAHLRPLFLAFRPLNVQANLLDLKQFTVNEQIAVFANRTCKRITAGVESYWVDCEDQLIQGYWIERDGVVGSKTDLFYEPNPTYGRVLTGWRFCFSDPDGSIIESSDARILECTINPPDIDGSEFEIDFPAGVTVYDHTQPSEGQTFTTYIVRNGGEKAIVPQADRISKTHDELIAAANGGPFYSSWIFILCNGVILVLVVGALWRRWHIGH